MPQRKDEELVAAVLGGETEQYSDLVKRYQGRIVNYLYRLLRNVDDAHDLAQEVFLRVYNALDRYNPEYKFFSWIYRIATNESINYRSRSSHEQSLDEDRFAADSHPDHAVEDEQLSDVIQAGLMSLQDDYRTVVVLRHFSELSYRDISKILHIPEKTVKSRLYSARQLMKARLHAMGVS